MKLLRNWGLEQIVFKAILPVLEMMVMGADVEDPESKALETLRSTMRQQNLDPRVARPRVFHSRVRIISRTGSGIFPDLLTYQVIASGGA